MPLIGYLPDVQPIIDFMNTSPHDQYRYLTLGLGTQVSKIAIWTHASSVDGDYNSARTLPEMTQYAVAQFSTAKHFGTEGMAALQAMLRHADRYGLKYIFCADRYYEPLLTFGGWRKIREFNGGEITVWWNPFVPPAQKVPSDAVPPRWQALMWGTLPFGSSLFAIVALILFSDRPQRRPDKTRTDDEVEFPPLRPKPVPDFSTVKSAGTMKICLVTAFPPGRGDLNEYGYHLARELHQYPNVSLTVLADRYDKSRGTELPNFEIRRCWSFNSTANPLCLLRELRKIRPNVIWFNMGFSTFGNKPLPAFLGVITAALARMLPARTHITLHTFMGNVDLRDAGVRFPWLYRLGGKLALRILLLADGISVLLPSYRRLLIDEYGASPAKIHVHCHGVFWQGSENTGFNWPRVPTRILALGNWGTYKRLEILLEAFQQLANAVGESRLVIAGASHPKTPGYVESISEQWRSSAKIEFLGYVPEQNLAQLFRSSTVAVLPYTSTAGSSGVVHLASQHGVPIVAADLPQLQELARCEGLAMEFYRGGDADDLARKLQDLLASEEQQRRMAEQNYAAAQQLGIAEVVAQYLDCFIREMQREVRPAVLDFA
jgi:glycosyltransferase involved in cell wall biosynthesis